MHIPVLETVLIILALSGDKKLDDKSLYEAIKNGDQAAFKAFFNDHYQSLYRFMRSRGMSHDVAEDMVQKAFIMIWEKRSGIDQTKSLRAYLFRIAYTRMLNHVEYHSKFNDEELADTDTDDKNPESDFHYEELLAQIKRIIASMPEKRALVFELCFMKQFTYKETAEALDVSVKTVENHMALAFKDMRGALTDLYGDEIFKRI
jgi:RNA polymerase sigma-70 factor (ECF subfamily)